MSIDPLIPIGAIVAVSAVAIALAVVRLARGAATGDVVRTTLVVGLFVVMALDPATGGGTVTAAESDADVLFVVDTTGSAAAEDYQGTETRLTGMKADILATAEEFPGSRFAVISFDTAVTLELPWTTDVGALQSSVDVIDREQTMYSQGSRLDAAQALIVEQLDRAAERNAERDETRAQFVFFLSDGELTEGTGWNSFAAIGDRIAGGAVYGYGTEAGGRMLYNYGYDFGTSTEYIYDFATGEEAVSRIDEEHLTSVADELGVDYLQRTAPGGLAGIADAVRADADSTTTATATDDPRAGARHWYWLIAVGAAAVGIWQTWSTTTALVDSRRLVTRGARS